jgi:hypothetical protein
VRRYIKEENARLSAASEKISLKLAAAERALAEVRRCRLTESKPLLKALLVSALEATI